MINPINIMMLARTFLIFLLCFLALYTGCSHLDDSKRSPASVEELYSFLQGLDFDVLSDDTLEYIYNEQVLNEHFNQVNTASQVSTQYAPFSNQVFEIPYLDIPVEELHVVDSGHGLEHIRKQIFVQRGHQKYFRFFIHPDSRELYEPLFQKYRNQGHYYGTPTASTRSLIIWDYTNAYAKPLIAKLTLDKQQFGLGRAIPDWEVRKSVAMTKQLLETDTAKWQEQRVEVIQEFAGAYVDESSELASYVDDKQGTIFQHGLVFRDSSFIERADGLDDYSVFSLFAERKGSEPLIIEMWKKSGKSWEQFFDEDFIKPIVEATSYLTMEHGFVPEMHGQNIGVKINPKTLKIEQVLHKDIGSMKVDLRLRWLKGLGVEHLISKTTMTDFKFNRATELHGTPYFSWFYSYLFTDFRGGDKILKKYIPNYNEESILTSIQKRVQQGVKKHWGLDAPIEDMNAKGMEKLARQYYAKHSHTLSSSKITLEQKKTIRRYINYQRGDNAVVSLDQGWQLSADFKSDDYALTDYGIVYKEKDGSPNLVPYMEGATKEELLNGKNFFNLKIADLYSGQVMIGTEKNKPHVEDPENPRVFEVVKAGTEEEPFYVLLDGHHTVRRMHRQEFSSVPVRVVEDITHLSPQKQEEFLERRGEYWSPENSDGGFKKIKILDLEYHPARDLYKQDKKRGAESFKTFKSHHLNFKEIIYAREQYQQSRKNTCTQGMKRMLPKR